MNFNTYGSYYGKFHQCSVSSVQQDILVFDFGTASYETWFMTRMYPPDTVSIDSNKALLLALKTFFKSDVPASVVCNRKYLWTILLGNKRVVYPVGKGVQHGSILQLYATPFFVDRLEVIHHYLEGIVRPTYENVFFYKNTVLYLDNEDLPYPGGYYFNKCDPTPYYRLCFLSTEPMEYVLNLAAEWRSRQSVITVPYMTLQVEALPKFIQFKPLSESGFNEAPIASTGIIHKVLSSKKPEHLIQDILTSYYKNTLRRAEKQTVDFNYLGLYVQWPFLLTFEGARHPESKNPIQKFVALSINGTHPSRVLFVSRPYDRYIEYNHVPATIWTPVSFVLSTLLTEIAVRKVAIDTVVLGIVYRETFFCFNQPLLEGTPTPVPMLNGKYILSKATFELNEDANIRVLESLKLNDRYALHRVSVRGIPLDGWCIATSTNPYPKNNRLTGLVREWVDFFMEVGEESDAVEVSAVRLALMLSKHNLCFNLNAIENPSEVIRLSDKEVHFNLSEKVVQFINDARLMKTETPEKQGKCTIS